MFDRGIHDDVPDPGLVYLCSTYLGGRPPEGLLDFVRAQGNEPDRHALGTYRMGGRVLHHGRVGRRCRWRTHTPWMRPLSETGVSAMPGFRITDLKAETFSYAIRRRRRVEGVDARLLHR